MTSARRSFTTGLDFTERSDEKKKKQSSPVGSKGFGYPRVNDQDYMATNKFLELLITKLFRWLSVVLNDGGKIVRLG